MKFLLILLKKKCKINIITILDIRAAGIRLQKPRQDAGVRLNMRAGLSGVLNRKKYIVLKARYEFLES